MRQHDGAKSLDRAAVRFRRIRHAAHRTSIPSDRRFYSMPAIAGITARRTAVSPMQFHRGRPHHAASRSSRFPEACRHGRRHLHRRPVPGPAAPAAQAADFHFVQFSDTHWGYSGAANPDAEHTLEKAVATVNGLAQPARLHRLHRRSHPHHRRPQGAPRAHEALPRDRLGARASRTCASCRASTTPRSTRARPSRSSSAPPTTRSTTRACTSSRSTTSPIPAAKLGDEQLAWLAADLKQRKPDDRIVVLTHRPLFDLQPQWDWTTRRRRQGDRAPDALPERRGVLRPHPPGAPPHDGPHRPSCGQVADLPAARARLAAQAHAACPTTPPCRAGLGTRDVAVADKVTLRRAAGHQGLRPCIAECWSRC